jgi:hypothetical protein
VGQHLIVGSVQQWFVTTSFIHAAAKIVWDHQRGHSFKETEGASVRADPIGETLSPGRFCVGVVGGAQHGHEDLRLADLASDGVDDGYGRTSVIHEQLFPGAMRLPHHQLEMGAPLLVMKTELGVAVALFRVRGPILFPEQEPRHAFFFQLFVDVGKVRSDVSSWGAGGLFGAEPVG